MNVKRWMINKRGQVTIFIIIAIIIVAAALLIYSFYPQIQSSLGVQEQNPNSYIQFCLENDLKDTVNKISTQGGDVNPVDNYVLYNDTQIKFLCYTGEFYRSCIIQQPMLKQHIESEINKVMNSKVDACFASLKQSYEGRGYTVTLQTGIKNFELLPKRVAATLNYSLVLTKGTDVQKYNSFVVFLNNNIYELSSIANSILNWESLYGDSETTTYMTFYHDLKVEKKLGDNGAKIYILTDRVSGNKFQFAVRSQVWPAGYIAPTA
ncbi:Uncharacterised protein [uncultured archaeon]|nr:Uncharacterised protein [uncultured archaeon]